MARTVLPRQWGVPSSLQDFERRITGLEKRIVQALSGVFAVVLRITSGSDASPTSTGHPFQIGPSNGLNSRMDSNEIMAANNGLPATININPDGGAVTFNQNIPGGTDRIRIEGGQVIGPAGSYEMDGTVLVMRWTGASGNYVALDQTGGQNRCRIQPVYDFTTTNSENVYVGGAGNLHRVTSLRATKLEIEDAPEDWAEKVLNLRPRTWLDRSAVERYSDYLTSGQDETVVDPSDIPQINRRIPGFIAEEVVEAGLEDFATYDEKGDLNGLAYSRITAGLVAVVQAQKAQIDALTARLDALDGGGKAA